MKVVMVTGASGFVGTHVVKYLREYGLKVIAVLHDEVVWSKWLQESLADTVRMRGDVRDTQFIMRVLNQYGVTDVIHLAAQSIVKRAYKDPVNTYSINIMGTVSILEAARQLQTPKVLIQSCYDEKTRVVTNRGIKTYSEVNVGDEVLSLNPETLEIERKKVEEVIVQNYAGKMVHFKSRRINLMVTPNHRMLIPFPNVRKSPKRLQEESAERTMKRSVCSLPMGRWTGKDEDTVTFEGVAFPIDPLLYLIGVYIGDGFPNITKTVKENRTGLSRREWLQRAGDPVTGKFTALGKVGDREETISHGYGVFLDIPKNDPCRERVRNTLKELNIGFHEYEGHVFFTSKVFAIFLKEECGEGAKNKHIPSWALQYSPRHLQHLFDGLIDSDGHRGRYQTIFDSSSKEVLHGFVELCTKIGRNVSISWRWCSSIIEGRKVEGGGYHCYISKSNRALRRKIATLVDYNGIVWCLKVADNHNLLVEREGRFAFSGNTDKVYGDDLQATVDSKLVPTEPYGTSKVCVDMIAQTYRQTYGMPVVVTRPCLFPRTHILTTSGYKEICKIQAGEEVMTHEGRYRRVIQVFKRAYSGVFYRLSVTGPHGHWHGVTLTAEHPVLTKEGWVEAQNLKIGVEIAVIARSLCERCKKPIPNWRQYCSRICARKDYMEKESVEQRKSRMHNLLNLCSNEDWVIKRAKKTLAKRGMNNHEFYIDLVLQSLAPEFKFVGDGKVFVGTKCPDWIWEERKKIIEYFGKPRRDPKAIEHCINFYREHGYEILILTGKEFHNPKVLCEMVQKFRCNHEGLLPRVYIPLREIEKRPLRKRNKSCTVYNLSVDDDDSFIAHEICLHNCNVYGYDPCNDRIIPNTIKKCIKGEKPFIFKDEGSLRQYVFVDDVCEVFQDLLELVDCAPIVNIGSNTILSQQEVVLEILKSFPGLSAEYVEKPFLREIHSQYMGEFLKAKKPTCFTEGIRRTIEQFKHYGF